MVAPRAASAVASWPRLASTVELLSPPSQAPARIVNAMGVSAVPLARVLPVRAFGAGGNEAEWSRAGPRPVTGGHRPHGASAPPACPTGWRPVPAAARPYPGPSQVSLHGVIFR